MKRLALSLFLLSLQVQAGAKDPRTKTGFFGFGLDRSACSVETAQQKANFEGWSPFLEAGLNHIFSDFFSVSLSGKAQHLDLKNINRGSTFIEEAEGFSTGATASAMFGKVGVGGGISSLTMKITNLSTTSAKSETVISGQTKSYFINYNLEFEPKYRIVFQLNQKTGNLGSGNQFSELGLGMSFYYTFKF